MRVVAIVQCRMGSARLPGKALRPLAGEPMLWRVVERVRDCALLDEVIVATGRDTANDPIRALCAERGVRCYSGHDTDVLTRYHDAMHWANATFVLRVTGDCPLTDPGLLGRLVAQHLRANAHYSVIATVGDIPYRRYPDGMDGEMFSGYALEWAWGLATRPDDREHVGTLLWREPRPLETTVVEAPEDLGHLRLTVDTLADYAYVAGLYDALQRDDRIFGLADILRYLRVRT